MGRNIVTKTTTLEGREGPIPPQAPDNYTSQIIKLIPAEIVGVYLGLQNMFSTLAEWPRFISQLIVFLIILFISPFYLRLVGGITDRKQRMIAIISYIIWCISLGGPFQYLLTELDSVVSAQLIGGALIVLYTLIVPMLYKMSTDKP